MIWAILATAALFALYGLVASHCDCQGERCAGCPYKELHDES